MILELKNIFKSYKQAENNISVLKDLNFQLNPKEIVAIIGESGSGKSSLLALLAGLEKPDQGSISFQNKNIGQFSKQESADFRAKHLGIVFQQFFLVSHLNAWENIALVLEMKGDEEAKAKALQFLKKVKLEHRADHFPSQLSGGECQRLALARALIAKPDILIADEPSGSLDENTASELMQMFFELVKESSASCVLVTHSKELAKKADRVLILKNGQLQAWSAE